MTTWQLRHPAPIRWDFLSGVLPHRIEPMDVDLCIERRGHFLILEGKQPNERMPRGQKIALDALAARPEFTVITFIGHPPDEVLGYSVWGEDEVRPATTETLRDVVRQWFSFVEQVVA